MNRALTAEELEQVYKMAAEHGDLGLAAIVKVLAVARAMDAATGLPIVEPLLADDLTAFVDKLDATIKYGEWLQSAGK